MKYKVGDEVLVKAKIIDVNEKSNELKYIIARAKVIGTSLNNMRVKESDIVPQPDMTAEEAWEIAKKLFADYSNIELDEIFGKGWSFPKLMELTPQEAKAKIEAWEIEKEIKAGDLVEFEGNTLCVTGFLGIYCCAVDKKGLAYSVDKKDVRKTGLHIDIEGLLKQIGGDEKC